jgi:hypothetical protein
MFEGNLECHLHERPLRCPKAFAQCTEAIRKQIRLLEEDNISLNLAEILSRPVTKQWMIPASASRSSPNGLAMVVDSSSIVPG